MASKTIPKRTRSERFFLRGNVFFAHFWVHFLTTFWPSFGPPLDVSLGVSWEPSRASWGSLGRPLDPKTLKNLIFSGFWRCSFLALWSSWCLSWAHLAPSWADQLPKWTPKWAPKVIRKVTKKWFKKRPQTLSKMCKFGVPKWVPKWAKMAVALHSDF